MLKFKDLTKSQKQFIVRTLENFPQYFAERNLGAKQIHASYYFNPEGISTTAGGASLDETGRILLVCHQEIESQKLNIDESSGSPNIKKYGLADGLTLDLIEEIGLLSRTSKL